MNVCASRPSRKETNKREEWKKVKTESEGRKLGSKERGMKERKKNKRKDEKDTGIEN